MKIYKKIEVYPFYETQGYTKQEKNFIGKSIDTLCKIKRNFFHFAHRKV